MADNVAITAGSGTTVATDNIGGVNYQRVKITWGADGTATDADIASASPLPVQLRNSAGQLISDTTGILISTSQLSTLQTVAAAMSAGYQLVGIPTDQTWKTGMSNRAFAVAFATLTRPANTTAYAAADSISDNATAGSVTALVSAAISDTNDDLLFLSDILVSSTDTGLAGKRIRAYLFTSDPTASSGVGGGDNAAFSQKKAGYLASFSGVLETGFSDGTVGRLTPSFNDSATAPVPNAAAGGFVVTKPSSGGKLLWIQYQTLDAFTPSANSTTIIGTARGWQARAA